MSPSDKADLQVEIGEPVKPEPERQWRWTIDVCRTCGRHAVWPGCEHWQSEPGWCKPVVVKAVGKFKLG